MGMGNKLTDAPCIFCGYSGPEYYQRGSHAEDCPWHSIGGGYERVAAISDVARGMFVELRRLRAELARLKPLAEAAQWVPVTEALPGERNPDEGIVALLENGVRVDAMHGKEGWFQWDYELSDWLPLVGVTHWYRVPPPPTK